MQNTLRDLLSLLIAAIPTMLLLAFLTGYLNAMLFRPLAKVFKEREKATDGARELARQAFEAVDKKNSEYELALEKARAQIHKEREELRRKWSEEQAHALKNVRTECESQIQNARREMLRQIEQEQAASQQAAEFLSQSVVEMLLEKRAA